MAYWLMDVCLRADMTDPVLGANRALRAGMLKSFVDADKLSRRAGRVFTHAEHMQYSSLMRQGLLAYNALAAQAMAANVKNYKLVPKFHAVVHIILSRLNPRKQQCYDDEDMVGKIMRIFVKCHVSTASERTLQRYVIMIALRWWSKLHDFRRVPL